MYVYIITHGFRVNPGGNEPVLHRAHPKKRREEISLYTILPGTILYGVWHENGGGERGSDIAQ